MTAYCSIMQVIKKNASKLKTVCSPIYILRSPWYIDMDCLQTDIQIKVFDFNWLPCTFLVVKLSGTHQNASIC